MQNHRFSDALWIPSPHFDERPDSSISLIVIHAISLPPGLFNPLPVLAFFQGTLNHEMDAYFEAIKTVRVSSHLVIGRDGAMYQPVAFDQRAWHAGESSFSGQSGCNDFSIGIELIGAEEGPFTDAQYRILATVCQRLCQTYDIPVDQIVGHRDIAPGRKVDPGADFD
ncbi:MAG: 1,6-anhydro-N-acetylmuramyl-L-alanine amidase AmpD, partial [Oceanospirillales bacterium]|nr:1,6-anhydro-N-acetylmuramyl-L-alanine amidase AmpD [Oceanospirillales bacterium]